MRVLRISEVTSESLPWSCSELEQQQASALFCSSSFMLCHAEICGLRVCSRKLVSNAIPKDWSHRSAAVLRQESGSQNSEGVGAESKSNAKVDMFLWPLVLKTFRNSAACL